MILSGLNSLILSIISSAAIFILFKACERYGRDVLALICYNYFGAFVLSLISSVGTNKVIEIDAKIIFPAIITGVLFIAVFFIISLSSKFAGISRTTLASKMSFVVPVLFSVIYYSESLNLYKVIGFILAILSVIMVVYKSDSKLFMAKSALYPIILFIGAGIVDSVIKFIQQSFLIIGGEEFFTSIVFGIAFVISLFFVLFKGGVKRLFSLDRFIGGLLLGIANYGSLYFLIKTLNSMAFDSSVVFCIINTGIVFLNVCIGIFIFRERITLLNKIGIFLALIAILTLTLL